MANSRVSLGNLLPAILLEMIEERGGAPKWKGKKGWVSSGGKRDFEWIQAVELIRASPILLRKEMPICGLEKPS